MSKRKSKTTNGQKKKKPKSTTPKDKYFEALEAVIERENADGQMLVTGVSADADPNNLSADECDQLRYILINKQRGDLLDYYEDIILGDQADDSFLMFDTSFSYKLIPLIARIATKKFKSDAEAFNHLFAFSYNILQFDVWAHDNEDEYECLRATSKLGKAWKKLLKKDNAQLKIDAEYTRPAIVDLLKKVEALTNHIDGHKKWGL